MISAKDEFFLEREQINELMNLINNSDLTHDERDKINLELITEQEFEQLKKDLSQRELKPLERLKRGGTMLQGDINKAVKRASEIE